MRYKYTVPALIFSLLYPFMTNAQTSPGPGVPSSTTFPINAPNGLVGLDAAGYIRSPTKGSIDNGTVGGVPIVNLLPAFSAQQRTSTGLTLSELSTPGILSIIASLKNTTGQADQDYTITSYGSTDGTLANAKNAVNFTLTKNLWNTSAQNTVPYGETDTISSTVNNGGFGVLNTDGSYAGSDGAAYTSTVNAAGYGDNAMFKGTAQYVCADSNADNALQPVECSNTGIVPYALTTQIGAINIQGSASTGHTAYVHKATISAGLWEGLVFNTTNSGALDRLVSYTDTNNLEQAYWTASGTLSTADIEVRALAPVINTTTGATTYSSVGCVSLGQDPNGRIAIGCGNTGSAPYLDMLGPGYGTSLRIAEPKAGQFQLLTKGSANDSFHDVFDCNALPSCWFSAPVSTNSPVQFGGGTKISNGATVAGGLISDTMASTQTSLTAYTFASLGTPSVIATQKYCADCYSSLRSSTYYKTGLVVTWNGSDWTDVIGNPVGH